MSESAASASTTDVNIALSPPISLPGPKMAAFPSERRRIAVPGTHHGARALESLAGRLTDTHAQIAVAAELIRLRQQGA